MDMKNGDYLQRVIIGQNNPVFLINFLYNIVFYVTFTYNIIVRRFTVCGMETPLIQTRFTMYDSETLFIQIRFTMCGMETLFTSLRCEPETFFDKMFTNDAEILLWLNAGYIIQPLILHK